MHRRGTAVSMIITSRLVCRHFGYDRQNVRLRSMMKLIRVWSAVNYEAQARSVKDNTYSCRRGSSGSGPNGGTNGSLRKTLNGRG